MVSNHVILSCLSFLNLVTDALVITSLSNLTTPELAGDYVLNAISNAPVNGTGPPPGLPYEAGATLDPQLASEGRILRETDGSITNLQNQTFTHPDDSDVVTSGNWVINKCDAANSNSHAEQLLTLLPQIWDQLQSTISQINVQGIGSSYGYYAFFKAASNAASVSAIYEKMARGDLLDVGGPDHSPYRPQIRCITEQDAVWHKFCSGAVPIAFHMPQSNIIALCDKFWDYPPGPESHWCPEVDRFGVLGPNTAWLQYTQSGALVHEMTEMYLNEKNEISLTPEVYRVADAAALSADQAALNPSNFAFFYSSVTAKCTSWPLPPNPELL